MKFVHNMTLAILFCCPTPVLADVIINTVSNLASAVYNGTATGCRYDIVATITKNTPCIKLARGQTITVCDSTGHFTLLWPDTQHPLKQQPGDRVEITGTVSRFYLNAETVTTLSHGPAPAPRRVTTADINNERATDQLVTLEGVLTEVFNDEIDPNFAYLVISDNSGAAYVPYYLHPEDRIETFSRCIGSCVSVTGVCVCHHLQGGRKHIGMELELTDMTDFKHLSPVKPDPFNVPTLHDRTRLSNPVVAGDLTPRKVCGRVLATWQGNHVLVTTDQKFISKISLSNTNLPDIGSSIEVVGTPETDLYQLNLSKAIWRKAPDIEITDLPPEAVTAAFMLTNSKRQRQVKTGHSGRTIRISGLVRALPAAGNGDFRLNLLCDEYEVPVDFSSVPEALDKIESGCVIEVTGVCVIESENWRPQTPFPHAKGFSVILRTADDVRVISRPPWWTPKRLAVVIGVLLLAVVAVGIRNRVLKRMSELRVKDRTRLAVELHDALSQTLTGVALELQTTSVLANANSPAAIEHLNIASKTLLSCRQELRNCLQDLRSTALDLPNMSEAIHLTLEPHVADAKVSVRFNVPRKELSDNAAHAVISIVRELTLNAIRHGRATAVRIAGVIDGDQLLFSVRDNGSGFDPDDRPGVRQGHFGLQGVLERVRALGGSLEITSKPGHGARVAGTMAALS